MLGQSSEKSSSPNSWKQGNSLQEGSLLWLKIASIRSKPMNPSRQTQWIVFCQLFLIFLEMKKSESKSWSNRSTRIGSKRWEREPTRSKKVKNRWAFSASWAKFGMRAEKRSRKNPKRNKNKRNTTSPSSSWAILTRRWMTNSSRWRCYFTRQSPSQENLGRHRSSLQSV